MPKSGWHRVFHPLCGVDLVTLVRLIAQNGPPSSAGSLRLGIALASSIGRLPFTLAERAWTALAQQRPAPAAMRLLLEEVDRLPSHAITHVRFEELERDPLGQVERIYRSIKLDGHEVARPRIEAYLRSIQNYIKSTYTISKESVRRVTQAWQPFIACFGYHPPDLERYAA